MNHQINQQDSFHKILRQLAGQLWQSKLQDTLSCPRVRLYLTEEEYANVSTYEQLVDLLIAKELVTPSNITLLKAIVLCSHEESGPGLLRAVYEAGYGREGLSSDETELGSRLRTSSSSNRRLSFGQQCKTQRDFKQLLRKIDAQLDSSEDLGALKLLCCSVLSFGQLDGITSALDLGRVLRRQRCITLQNPEFLYRILQDCGRCDLCDLVDSYVYTRLKNPTCSESCSCMNSVGERKTSDKRECYQFARGLKHVGDQLGADDLATMKLLAGTWIPDSRLEKASNVYEFFILLQDRGKLSQNNLSFLEQLLDDKIHVISPLYDQGFGGTLQVHSTYTPTVTVTSKDCLMNFKRLLKAVGSRLTVENIRDIKYICSDEISSKSLSSVQSGIDLLSLLEKRGIIYVHNVDFLMDALKEIGRIDLRITARGYREACCPECARHDLTGGGSPVVDRKSQDVPNSPTNNASGHLNSPEQLHVLQQLTKTVSTDTLTMAASQLKHSSSTDLLLALSKQTILQESELRARERESEEFKRKMEVELAKKDKQITELTKKLNSQEVLLRELVQKLGMTVQD